MVQWKNYDYFVVNIKDLLSLQTIMYKHLFIYLFIYYLLQL